MKQSFSFVVCTIGVAELLTPAEKKTMKVYELLTSVFGIIRDYLIDYTDGNYPPRDVNFVYWRRFLNCSTELLEIKKNHYYYKLSNEASVDYLHYPTLNFQITMVIITELKT
jgi:hypothetical protein